MRTSARNARPRSSLRAELAQAVTQIDDLQSTLHAIRSGEVDAIVVDGHPAIVADEVASAAGVSNADTIDQAASTGRLPDRRRATSLTGDCSGALRFDLTIPPQSTITRSFVCPVLPGRKAPGHQWITSASKDVFVDNFRRDSADVSTPQPDPGLNF